MKVFVIEVPSIANKTLKTCTGKEIEIFEGVCSKTNTVWSEVHIDIKTTVRKGTKKSKEYRTQLNLHRTDFLDSIARGQQRKSSRILAFDTFDKALISKYVLLENLKKHYKSRIEELQEFQEKNIPSNIKLELTKYKTEYPELFI